MTLLERWTGPAAQLLVGEFDGVVVGLLAATAGEGEAEAGRVGRIECCYVETGSTRGGRRHALMVSGVEWCDARGCGEIDALALPGDRTTKQRLEASGFTARLLMLNRLLN